jgi:predicted NAD-dependent protein-ADP-ribosyltransferase YbiA (DUF1768 family)
MAEYLKFHATGEEPLYVLSNFYRAGITVTHRALPDTFVELNPALPSWMEIVGTLEFSSSEHLWQALKAKKLHILQEFTRGYRLGDLTPQSLMNFYPRLTVDKLKRKYAHWAKKHSVGIIAKLASNPKHAKKLGWTGDDMDYARERPSAELLKRVWLDILRLKYEQNPELRAILLETAQHPLQEFDCRGGFWGACMKKGQLVGGNTMGKFMMETRDALLARIAETKRSM